jgi:hypothetical protein
MAIHNYGKKLIKDGDLICEPRLIYEHDFYKIWTPDFMESIVFFKASKDKYTSSLNFFWQSIFHQREVTNQIQAEEVFTLTHLYKVTLQEAKEKILACCPDWYADNKQLIPDAKWTHIIWNDSNDVFIMFEDKDMYYGWGWDTTL